MSVRRSKTLVLAATRADAIKWCRQNNVGPYARDTYIATTEANLRGFELHDGDRVVVVSLSWPLIQAWSVVQHMADAREVRYTQENAVEAS